MSVPDLNLMKAALALTGYFEVLLGPGLVYFSLQRRIIRFDDIHSVVAVSLLANGLVAFVLVLTGMLSQAAWLAVALACLLTVILRRPRADLGLKALTLCLLAVSVCFLGDDFRSAFLRVFTTSDAVYSWNRWALDWFSGTLPVFSMSYPQLIPANWSVLYVLHEVPLEVLARTLMPLFSLLLVVSYARLKETPFVLLIASLTCLSMLLVYFPRYIGTGYVDIAVAYFTWCAIQTGYNVCAAPNTPDLRFQLLTGALIAVAASLTKQSGWFAVLCLQIVYWSAFRWKSPRSLRGERIGTALVFSPLLLALALSLPWYAYKHLLALHGQERDILAFLLTSIHGGKSYAERLIHSWSLLTGKVHPFLLVLFFLVCLISIRRSSVARLNLFFSGSMLLVWALFFGYGTRNMSVAVPLLSLSFASGLDELLRTFKRKLVQPELSSAIVVSTRAATVLGTVGIVVLFFLLSGRALEEHQSAQIDARGDHVLNAFLVDHFENEECEECVLTNYRYIEANPKLRRIYFPQYRVVMVQRDRPLSSMENFRKWLDSKRIRYVLFSRKRLRRGVADYIEFLKGEARSGRMRIIADNDRFFLVKKESFAAGGEVRGAGVFLRRPAPA